MKKIIKNHKISILATCILLIIYVITDIAMAFLFGKVIDTATSSTVVLYKSLIIFAVSFMLFSAFIYYLYFFQRGKTVNKISKNLKDSVFSSLINLKFKEFYKNDLGEKISILTNDIKLIEDDYLKRYTEIFRSILLFTLSVLSIWKIDYNIAIFLVLNSSLSLIIPNLLSKKLEESKILVSESQSNYTAKATEYLSGYSTIRSFGIIKHVMEIFNKKSEDVENKLNNYLKFSMKINSVSLIIGGISFMGCFLIGGYLVIKNLITVGELIICIQLSNNVSQPIYSFMDNFSSIKSVGKILEKLEYIIVNDQMKYEEYNKIQKISLNNKIIIDDLSFSYGKDRILNNISLEFEKGKKYSIVGASGSGKTTLINLIGNKIIKTSGEITLDDIKIEDIDENSLLNLITFIEQDIFIFKGTLEENIKLFKNYSKDEILYTVEKVGLSKFMEINAGLNTEIKEKGETLSGGEKQRIAIGRAIIRKASVILADEVFSNLDNETADKVEKTLLNLEDITVISITHRFIPENLKKYDSIIVIKDGKIECEGNFDELMVKCRYFKKMFEISTL